MTTITVAEQISVFTFGAVSAESESEMIRKVFKEAAEKNIVIDMISRVPTAADKSALGFTFRDEDTPEILKITRSLPFGTPIVNSGNVKLIVKSEEMVNGTGFAEKVFAALSETNTNPILITTALDEISVIVRESDAAEFEKKLNELFA